MKGMKQKSIFITIFLWVIFVVFSPKISAQVFILDEENNRNNVVDIDGIWGNMGVVDYEDDTYLPVGNGLWVLAAAAGLYLLVKKKQHTSRTPLVVAVLIMTLATTQCRKSNQNENETPEGQKISISFTAKNGGSAKTDVNLNNGEITWNLGDKVYVVCNNATNGTTSATEAILLGDYLTAQIEGNVRSKVRGTVTIPSTHTIPTSNAEFMFYYVGSGVTFTPTAGATSLSFTIDTQTGTDAGEYMIGRTDTVIMDNSSGSYIPTQNPTTPRTFTPLTAVLWLDSYVGFGNCSMTMSGEKTRNAMSIDLSNSTTPTYSVGTITFSGSNNAQISVLPTTPIDEKSPLVFSGNSKNGIVTVKRGIKAGNVYAKLCNNEVYPIPVMVYEGTLPGLFSVAADKQVNFSPGNLQYQATTSTWRFAEHQYDYVGDASNGNVSEGGTKCNNANTSSSYSGWIDLFGWGCTGYQDTRSTYQNRYYPYSTDKSVTHSSSPGDSRNPYGYGPDYVSPYYSLTVASQSDWGYLSITNPTTGTVDPSGAWRTLTKDEWVYLLNTNNNTSDYRQDANRFAKAKLNGVCGMLVFPDGYNGGTAISGITGVEAINSTTASYPSSNISNANWATMESLGVVFLPGAGYRSQVTINNAGSHGSYWSTTYIDKEKAYNILFNAEAVQSANDSYRYIGKSVRLVQDFVNTNAGINEEYDIQPVINWGN